MDDGWRRGNMRAVPQHGTYSGYQHKCRCDDCKTAARDYQRSRRAKQREMSV